MSKASPAHSRPQLLVFSLPAILQGFMHAPSQSIVQGIYGKHTGLSLAALGTAVLLVRLFDALTDPLIGIAADAWHRRTGSHKTFVGIGTLVTILGLWNLFRPPPEVSLAYYTLWFAVSYLGWTITEIPYRAWSMELSSDYVIRTRIQTWLNGALAVGTILFYLVPYVARSSGIAATTEMDLGTLRLAAVFVAVAMPLANLLTILRVPDGATHREQTRPSARELWSAVIRNGPLIYFTLMFLLAGVVAGISQGAVYLYIDGYLGLGKQFAAISLFAIPALLVGIPICGAICRRFERQKVWAASLILTALAYLGLGMVPMGSAGFVPVTAVIVMVMLFSTCTYVAAPAMVGDVIDYGRWKFNRDHGGVYVSIYAMVSKSVSGLGVALGFILLDLLGYDAKAQVQTAQGVLAMKATIAWIPALGIALTAPFIWYFPITRQKHRQMIRDLELRDAAGNVTSAWCGVSEVR